MYSCNFGIFFGSAGYSPASRPVLPHIYCRYHASLECAFTASCKPGNITAPSIGAQVVSIRRTADFIPPRFRDANKILVNGTPLHHSLKFTQSGISFVKLSRFWEKQNISTSCICLLLFAFFRIAPSKSGTSAKYCIFR